MSGKDERTKLEIEAARIGIQCVNSFYFFFKTFWSEFSSESYVDNFHIELICNTLQEYGEKIARGEELRKTLIINIPPGSSKSLICTVAFPLYMWLLKPSCTSVNISYSADLSKEHQELSKNVPSSPKWNVLLNNVFSIIHGKPLEIVICNKNKVQNNYGGKRFNTSTGGAFTGRHCDLIIEDDPLNPEQAFSDAERATAIRFHDKTVSTRKKNDNCYLNIIIAQRLHEEDVPGHVLKKKLDITQICLPGELTSSTLPIVQPRYAIDLYTDGVLNPVRKGRKVLEDLKESLGTDAYDTQVLQLPFDIQNQDITPSMFKRMHAKELPSNLVWDVWCDGAFTDKKDINDPTGIDIITKIGQDIVVRKAYDVWKKLPDLLKFINELSSQNMFDKLQSRIFIEPKASGLPLAHYIESDTEFNFVLIGENNKDAMKLVNSGKRARHETIKPKAESGRIILIEDGIDDSWIDGYITQVCAFPKSAHDEHVDNLGYAIFHYYMKESIFIAEWAINKLSKSVIGSISVNLTSQEILARNGNIKNYSVTYEENAKGDVQIFDYPDTHYHHRYIVVVVMKSESERNGTSSIVVFDRLNRVVSCMYDEDVIATRKMAKKALEIAYLYDKAKLVVANKKTVGSAQNEELDISHLVINEIRKIGYDKLHSRLTVNNIKKTREREFGFEVNRSTSREIFIHLKDEIETGKITQLPLEVFTDISILERKKDTGEIDFQDGHEGNRGLAFAVALKVDEEMSDSVIVKNKERDVWHK